MTQYVYKSQVVTLSSPVTVIYIHNLVVGRVVQFRFRIFTRLTFTNYDWIYIPLCFLWRL